MSVHILSVMILELSPKLCVCSFRLPRSRRPEVPLQLEGAQGGLLCVSVRLRAYSVHLGQSWEECGLF